jgi:hypothetical protein
MPFSGTTPAHDAAYWNQFFERFISVALDKYGYKAYKSVDTPNNIIKNIIRELAMADLVLAVLTDNKPLVFYELGVRHSLRHGTIMILKEGEARPFDISNYGILPYKEGDLVKFTEDLGRYIQAAEDAKEDSPVADFLKQGITVATNTAIGKLRRWVELIQGNQLEASLQQIRELQINSKSDREQVSVVVNDIVRVHADGNQINKRAEEIWKDQTYDNKSLFPLMKERRWGFRIAQIKDKANRLTALAWETVVDPYCIVISEAHYYQDDRPY